MIRPRRVVVPLGLAFLLWPLVSSAQQTRPTAPASPLWGELRIPGGAGAARRVLKLGEPDGRWDVSVLVDLVHRMAPARSWSTSIESVERYVTAVDEVATASAKYTNGVSLAAAEASRTERDALKKYLELIGLSLKEQQRKLTVAIDGGDDSRKLASWLSAAGVDREAVARQLNNGDVVRLAIPSTVLPLPLPQFWQSTVFERGHIPVLDVLHERASGLLYVGLLSLDDETLAFLAARPGLIKRLRESAPAFGPYAGALRIRQGKIDLPGGPDTAPLWRALTGHNPSEIDEFIASLFSRDEHRLAMFYAAIDRLDIAHQRFALGTTIPAKSRVAWFADLYGVLGSIDSGWSMEQRPFSRPSLDPLRVLALVDLPAEGMPGPSWLPPLLDRVTSSDAWARKPADVIKALQKKDRTPDARWLVHWYIEDPKTAEDRFRLLRFFQRQYASAPRTAAPDVEAALRGFREMPTLMLSVERFGPIEPALAARIARGGHALSASGDRDDAVPLLSRWQVSLGLVEQIQRRRRMSPTELTQLLTPLADAAAAPRERVDEALTRWLFETCLPAFLPANMPAAAVEDAAISAWVAPASPSPVQITWEGLAYQLDDQGPVQKSARQIRQASPTLSLNDLVELERLRQRLQAGPKSVNELSPLIAGLEDHRGVLRAARAGVVPASANETLLDVITGLKRISKNKDLPKAAKLLPAIRVVQRLEADVVLPPLVYALAAAPTAQPAAIFADAWRNHTMLPDAADYATKWTKTVWQAPESSNREGGGTVIRGAWLGLDLALADARLPRVSEEGIAAPGPAMVDRAVIVNALAVRADAPRLLPGMDDTMAALARGRALLEAWRDEPPSREEARAALRRANIDEWRAGVVLWLVERRSDRAGVGLPLFEIARLGGASSVPGAWGVPSMPVDGCICVRADFPLSREVARGYWNLGLVGASATDLPLRIAEHVARMKLPLSVVADLMPAAVADWLWHMAPYAEDDWESLSVWAKSVDAEHVERYMLGLVASGHLKAGGQ